MQSSHPVLPWFGTLVANQIWYLIMVDSEVTNQSHQRKSLKDCQATSVSDTSNISDNSPLHDHSLGHHGERHSLSDKAPILPDQTSFLYKISQNSLLFHLSFWLFFLRNESLHVESMSWWCVAWNPRPTMVPTIPDDLNVSILKDYLARYFLHYMCISLPCGVNSKDHKKRNV